MRVTRISLLAVAAGLIATTAAAQEASPPFVMATYYRCDYVRQARADTLYRQAIAPALDRQIKAGNLTGYGFSSHRMGGVFRRLESWTAPSMEKLLAAQEAYNADMERTNPKASAEFDAICGSHDDYVWNRVLGSAVTPPPPPSAMAFSYSRYFTCSDEATADMVMGTVYAEIINKHQAAGHITSWQWLTHYFGGATRRILNWSGPDVMAVLKAEEMISSDMANHPMWSAFSQGCNSHNDYVWRAEVRSAP
ncbi:MAG TPA: hypothetical protein VLL51_07260 [Gemmatimonadales bacterium]|nr:hypothetical protein [Gemmatimonadales bacterium]